MMALKYCSTDNAFSLRTLTVVALKNRSTYNDFFIEYIDRGGIGIW